MRGPRKTITLPTTLSSRGDVVSAGIPPSIIGANQTGLSYGEPLMSQHRREFLQESAAIAAAAVAAGYSATSLGFAANETLNVGCIGTGGRCKGLMTALSKIQGVRITAVCDVWDVGLEEGKKLADPKAFATKDHHELLA